MAFGFWHSKLLFDRCEICCTWVAGLSSLVTAFIPPEHKQVPAAITALFVSLVALSKWRSKVIEEAHNKAKAKREQDEQLSWSNTLSRLKSESEAEKQTALDELGAIRAKFDNRLKTVIKAILADLHDRYFRGEVNEEKHKHRTTLFICLEEYRQGVTEKRLAIYARIGVHPESQCSWPVDDNDLDKCHGVAGKIWFHGSGNVTSAECEWPQDNLESVQKAAYAKSVHATVSQSEALNVKSIRFVGARIMARGERWGVLLLDSAKDGHITDNRLKKQLLAQYANLISSIIDRMEL